MKISIGADHGGSVIKNHLIEYITSKKIQLIDFGSIGEDSSDYPDFAFKVAESVKNKITDIGILVCATGLGMFIAANKVKGIRAALLTDVASAKAAKAHTDANVICFSGSNSKNSVLKMLEAFLKAKFEGGRHEKRINKIKDYENRVAKCKI